MATNPTTHSITKGAWVLVATAVTAGQVHILQASTRYRQTYRVAGGAAPTDPNEGAAIEGVSDEISADQAIDVYMLTMDEDGLVRVDL